MSRSEWMRGKCWDMAIALHKATKLPIYGLYDAAGICHHAFVQAPDDKGIDARGMQSLDRLRHGCAGQIVQPLSIDEIEARWVGRKLSSSEILAAKRFANRDFALKTAIGWALAQANHSNANQGDQRAPTTELEEEVEDGEGLRE